MDNTKIEWADATWNPVTGCLHGCEYCYARTMVNRFAMPGAGVGANVVGFVLDEKFKSGCGKAEPYPFGFMPTLHRYRLGIPDRWKKPRTIFVCSMADLFGDWVPDEWIAEVLAACANAPQHRYLFLTKNPKRYVELYAKAILPVGTNFWYGSTSTGPDAPF